MTHTPPPPAHPGTTRWHHLGLLFVAAGLGCFVSSCPAERRGPLAPAADSVAAAVRRLQCNGPRACFGILGDTTAFYEIDEAGAVSVVGREWRVQAWEAWRVDPARSLAVYDSVSAALDLRYGAGAECLAPRGPARRWRDGRLHVALRLTAGQLTLSRRLQPPACDHADSPARFL